MPTFLECEPGDQGSRTRELVQLTDHRILGRRWCDLSARDGHVHDSEAARVLAVGVLADLGARSDSAGIPNLRTVEDVNEFGTDLEAESLFGSETEGPAKIEVFLRTASLPEVAIKGARSGPERAIGGIRPRVGIQHDVGVGIDAAISSSSRPPRL
jgi:hypothetical protein